jgi:hypothetical protein
LNNGSYWLNLQNAIVNNGDPIYWDENSGVGCSSPGCPSRAFTIEPVPSESFTLYGGSNGTTPEPSSSLLFGTAAIGVGTVLRRKVGRNPKCYLSRTKGESRPFYTQVRDA